MFVNFLETLQSAFYHGHFNLLHYLLNQNIKLPNCFVDHESITLEYFNLDYEMCIVSIKRRNVPIDFRHLLPQSKIDLEKRIFSIEHALRVIEKYALRRRARRRIENFKKELIAKTWHPRRFLRWCLDEDEKKELKKDFS